MMTFKKMNELTAINGLNAVLGVFLFISPWLIGFQELRYASWNAWIGGFVIAILALAAIAALQEWEEWVNLLAGAWIAISPWILGFTGLKNVLWTHLAVGLIVAALAALELWFMHKTPTARAA
jgi:hypothetical protein